MLSWPKKISGAKSGMTVAARQIESELPASVVSSKDTPAAAAGAWWEGLLRQSAVQLGTGLLEYDDLMKEANATKRNRMTVYMTRVPEATRDAVCAVLTKHGLREGLARLKVSARSSIVVEGVSGLRAVQIQRDRRAARWHVPLHRGAVL